MPSHKSESKQSNLTLPTNSHDSSMTIMYDWLQEAVEHVEYGKVGIEFTIHQSVVTRVQKTVVLSEMPK